MPCFKETRGGVPGWLSECDLESQDKCRHYFKKKKNTTQGTRRRSTYSKKESPPDNSQHQRLRDQRVHHLEKDPLAPNNIYSPGNLIGDFMKALEGARTT